MNFLRNADDSYIWKIEDENKLMELYYELGNKWSEIAKYFPNTYLYRSRSPTDGSEYKLIRYNSSGLSLSEQAAMTDLMTTDCTAATNTSRWGYWSSSGDRPWYRYWRSGYF